MRPRPDDHGRMNSKTVDAVKINASGFLLKTGSERELVTKSSFPSLAHRYWCTAIGVSSKSISFQQQYFLPVYIPRRIGTDTRHDRRFVGYHCKSKSFLKDFWRFSDSSRRVPFDFYDNAKIVKSARVAQFPPWILAIWEVTLPDMHGQS